MNALAEERQKFVDRIKEVYKKFAERNPLTFSNWSVDESLTLVDYAKQINTRYNAEKARYFQLKATENPDQTSLLLHKSNYKALRKLNRKAKKCVKHYSCGDDYSTTFVDPVNAKVMIFKDQIEEMISNLNDPHLHIDILWEVSEFVEGISKIATRKLNAFNVLTGYELAKAFEKANKDVFPCGMPNNVSDWIQKDHGLFLETTIRLLRDKNISLVMLQRDRFKYTEFEEAAFNQLMSLSVLEEKLIDFYVDRDEFICTIDDETDILLMIDPDYATNGIDTELYTLGNDIASGMDPREAVKKFVEKYHTDSTTDE